jgi:L-malate glycosyltransferase
MVSLDERQERTDLVPHTAVKLTTHPTLRVTHLISGDLWAGAESQAYALLKHLRVEPGVALSAVLLNPGILADQLLALGIPLTVINERSVGPYGILKRLRTLLSSSSPHILHTHRYKENFLGAMAARWTCRPFLVKTVHGIADSFTGVAGIKMAANQQLDQFITKRYFSRIICVSHQIHQVLGESLPAEKLVTIHNGVDLATCRATSDRATTRKSLGLREDDVVLGTAGRLVPVKGFGFLIEAAEILGRTVPNLRCVIVGDGPEADALQKRIDELHLSGRVQLVGFRRDVWDILAALDIFVLPSLGEGVPMIILEAMALGTPIVATAVGGVPEVLTESESGLLVPPRDPEAIAAACARLLGDVSLRTDIVSRARHRVEAKFSAARMTRDVVNLYRDIARNGGP